MGCMAKIRGSIRESGDGGASIGYQGERSGLNSFSPGCILLFKVFAKPGEKRGDQR